MPNCLCTISNDDLIKGTETLIKSFLKNNSWFSEDILVLSNNKISILSDENKAKLLALYDKIKFIEVNEEPYNKITNYLKRFRSTSNFNISDFFKYEIFSISGYDRLVFLSSDCLVFGDIKELFNQSHEFTVIQESKKYPTGGYRYFQNSKPFSVSFNSGVFSIAGNMINSQITTRLLNYTLSKPDWELNEQSVMNDYFKNNDIQFLHNKFNTLKVCFPDSSFNKFDSDIRIIRYIGEKPWQRKTKSPEMIYQLIENLWLNYDNINISTITRTDAYTKVIDIPRPIPQNSTILHNTKLVEPAKNPIENKPKIVEPIENPRVPEEILNKRKLQVRPIHNMNNNRALAENIAINFDAKALGLNIVNLKYLRDLIKDKRVCLVANSSDLLKVELGEYIDSHDIVIRCNSFPIDKIYTGERTDIHCLYYLHLENLEKRVDTRIVFSPNLINWKNFLSFRINPNNQYNIINLYWPILNGIIGRDESIFPTTGFNMLRTIYYLGGYNEFNLVGFNWYEDGDNSIYRISEFKGISKTHNFAYEKKWVFDNLIKNEDYIISL